MDLRVRNAVWERDRGICQSCGKKVTETIDLVKDTAQKLSAIKEIPIFRWSNNCWKCGKETPIVTYNLEVNDSYLIGDIPRLDETLAKRYHFVKKTFSRTMRREVVANTCIHCGSLQGNWFTMEDLLEKLTDEEDMTKLIDALLPNDLSCDDVLPAQTRKQVELKSPAGHIHHKDGNWKNDDLDNLVLLCWNCHRRIKPHGRNAQWGESREEEKRKARRKREKTQTDVWRANYYAKRRNNSNKKMEVETEAEHLQRSISDYEPE
jgi:5-methylcytosine-specific restriction endonuclease McrA